MKICGTTILIPAQTKKLSPSNKSKSSPNLSHQLISKNASFSFLVNSKDNIKHKDSSLNNSNDENDDWLFDFDDTPGDNKKRETKTIRFENASSKVSSGSSPYNSHPQHSASFYLNSSGHPIASLSDIRHINDQTFFSSTSALTPTRNENLALVPSLPVVNYPQTFSNSSQTPPLPQSQLLNPLQGEKLVTGSVKSRY